MKCKKKTKVAIRVALQKKCSWLNLCSELKAHVLPNVEGNDTGHKTNTHPSWNLI